MFFNKEFFLNIILVFVLLKVYVLIVLMLVGIIR